MKMNYIFKKYSLALLSLAFLTGCNGGGGGSDGAKNPNTTASVNNRPVANAGIDKSVEEGQLVTLDGKSSFDPEGSSLNFAWRQISGIPVTLSAENDDTPSFIAPSGSHTLTFQLVVDDGTLLSIGDTVIISIVAISNPPSTNPTPNPTPSPTPSPAPVEETPDDSQTETDNPDNSSSDTDSSSDENGPQTPDTEVPSTDTDTSSDTSTPSDNEDNSDSSETEAPQPEEVEPMNTKPLADAGEPIQANGFNLVILDGSLSLDPQGDFLSYLWTQVSGPLVSLNNNTIATPNFDAPNINEILVFQLVVNDGEFDSDPDLVSVAIQQVNTAPIANAGNDRQVNGLSNVNLSGLSSSDAEGDLLTYTWEQTGGVQIMLDNSNSATPSFMAPNIDGTLSFTLTVNDGQVNSASDTINIVVTAINSAPLAHAGTDQEVNGNALVILNGSSSSDPENDDLTFQWTQTAGTSVLLDDPTLTMPSFVAPNNNETLSFSLVVFDGKESSSADLVSIQVSRINTPPIAHAGVDRYVGSQSVVALNGLMSSDPDGDNLAYTWQQLSGPAVSLNALNASKPIFTADTDGELIFSLVVNDGQNDSQADTVKVTVGPIPATNIKVNGTGITWGGNYPTGNNAGCIGEAIDQQDCSLGRELTHNDDSDGRAGFSFTKFDQNGVDVGNNASEWHCVQDSVTGLMWEVKTGGNGVIGDEGLNDADNRYSWYNSDPATNGGGSGHMNIQGNVCSDFNADDPSTHCNTQAFVSRMNKIAWCGFADWRLPTRKELLSIVDYGNARPMIDSDYFPETGQFIWTNTPLALGSASAWGVNFNYGNSFSIDKRNARQVRLVRGGYANE